MKRYLYLLLLLCTVLAVCFAAGCGGNPAPGTDTGTTVTDAPAEVPTEAPTEAPAETSTETPTEAPTGAPTEAPTQPDYPETPKDPWGTDVWGE